MGFPETGAGAFENEVGARTAAARLKLVTQSSLQAVPLNFAMSVLLVAILWGAVDRQLLLGWLGAMFAASVLRMISLHRARKLGRLPGRLEFHFYLLTTALCGALWGGAPFLLSGQATGLEANAIMLFVAGMAAGAAMTSAAEMRVVWAYNVPALGIYSVWFFLQHTASAYLIGATCILFFFVLIKLARTYSAHLVEAVEANVHLDETRRESEAQRAALTRLSERQEDAVRAAERQAASTAAMLSNVSRELAGPLHSVQGMTQMLQEVSLPGDAARMVARIKDSSATLGELVRGILDVSRIQSGELELKIEDASAMKLAETLESRYTPLCRAKGLDFDVELEGSLDLVVRTDLKRILQIADVFIRNAVEFTDSGSVTAVIRTERTSETMARGRLEIRDTGRGVPESAQSTLFTAFASNTGDALIHESSTGLGLHLCKLLAGLLEGEVGYRANEGGGAVFWFEGPLRVSMKEDKYADERLNAGGRRARVLVAESDPARRSVLLGYLKSFNCVVSCVPSSAEAIEALNAAVYDTLVLGLTLTDLDPDDAAAEVRTLASTASMTPIVRLAHNQDAPVRRAGSDAWVRSPVAAQPLLEGLRAVLSHDPSALAQLKQAS